jgi:hypothetical protein
MSMFRLFSAVTALKTVFIVLVMYFNFENNLIALATGSS